METFAFNWELEDARIVEAIRAAEARSSGEIRVYVSDAAADDPVTAAREQFARMGMHETAGRNGVLIFVAPRSRNFAIVGDEAVHAQCGASFWRDVADAMSRHFALDHPTEAIVLGIRKAGELLSNHFPCRPGDRNELPNEVMRGG
jgi:uncharacterized membrane protein